MSAAVTDRGARGSQNSRKPDECDDRNPTEERPNPCSSPQPPKEPCDCHKPTGSQDPIEEPCRPKPRPKDCCDQLIDLLGGLPGFERGKVHKPKQRPARKIQALCDALQMSDAVLPLLAELWKRFEEGEGGRNDFEKKVAEIFDALEDKEAAALAHAFAEYRKLRRSGKADCFFNDCLADAAKDGPVERTWVAEELLREGLKVTGMVVFQNSKGVMGPGQTRLWDNSVFRGPNGSGATI